MSKVKIFLLTIAALPCFISCFNKQYVEASYYRIYKVDSLFMRSRSWNNASIEAVCSWTVQFDEDSRRFYEEVDTSLICKGWRDKYEHKVSAIDWRITKIDFITNVDYDESHPAGSLINDLFTVIYLYKYEVVKKRMSDLSYGSIMLTDYYPYDDATPVFLQFHLINETGPHLNSFTIRLYDAFGGVYMVDSADWDSVHGTL